MPIHVIYDMDLWHTGLVVVDGSVRKPGRANAWILGGKKYTRFFRRIRKPESSYTAVVFSLLGGWLCGAGPLFGVVGEFRRGDEMISRRLYEIDFIQRKRSRHECLLL
jgi:hypothetical protein